MRWGIGVNFSSVVSRLILGVALAFLLVFELPFSWAQKSAQPDYSQGFQGKGPGRETQHEPDFDPSSGLVYGCSIVKAYPHDPSAFTQGLIFADGFLFESTGLWEHSTLRKVDLETGKVLRSIKVGANHFGEGLTLWKHQLIQLTWQSRAGFIYNKDTFVKEGEFRYEGEGWGITHDGRVLIMSNGSATLRFLDPTSFEEVGSLEVRDHGKPVARLNELEFIKGEIFANVWEKDWIAKISPSSGEVTGWIDLRSLRNALGPVQRIDALNGIAYDADRDRIFVTGKYWPKLFEIQILPAK